MEHFRLEDSVQAFEFDGERIAGPVSNRHNPVTGQDRPRSIEFTLYRTEGGGYVLRRVNHSDVVHDPAHPCDPSGKIAAGWKPVPRDGLDDHATSCHRAPAKGQRISCYPFRAGGDFVLAEQPRYTTDHGFKDPAAVIRRLSAMQHRGAGGGFTSDAVSDQIEELLRQAAEHDPAFRGPKPVVRIR